MNNVYNLLESSIVEAMMTWTPKILFPSSQLKISDHTFMINKCKDISTNSTNKSIFVQIVHCQSLSTYPNIIDRLSSQLHCCPQGTLFQFEGYTGVEGKQQ